MKSGAKIANKLAKSKDAPAFVRALTNRELRAAIEWMIMEHAEASVKLADAFGLCLVEAARRFCGKTKKKKD